MPLHTALCTLFDIRHPVLLAPMGGVSGGALAGAVTRAGGLGLVGGGYGDRAWLERELDAAGNERIGVGFITWSLDRAPVLLDLVLERAPAAIFLSFGDARPYVDRVKAAGAKLILQVQTLQQASAARHLGADLIVAQGTEAGGHGTSHRALFPLVPAVVDAVAPLPVAAAGGIADGRQLAAALALGAAGIVVGTRFFAAREALGHANAKARVVAAGGDDTVRTEVFDIIREIDWPAPYTGRAIANAFTARWHGSEAALKAALAEELASYAAARDAGDVDTSVVFAGEGLDLIRDLPPAGDIVEHLVRGAEAALKAAAGLVEQG